MADVDSRNKRLAAAQRTARINAAMKTLGFTDEELAWKSEVPELRWAERGYTLALGEIETLLLKVAELELLADDARGKRCPECSAPMVSLSTIDGGQRVCSGCDKVWPWHLKEDQPPLIGNNRMVKKV